MKSLFPLRLVVLCLVLCLALSLLSSRANAGSLPGWPVQTGDRTWGAVALADMDGDGIPEVVSVSDKIYVTKGDGTPLPGWPQPRLEVMMDSPLAVGDLDGDGKPEIVAAADRGIYAWNRDGTFKPGFPIWVTDSPYDSGGLTNVTLADLDGDGKLEVISVSYWTGKIYVWRHDGTAMPGWPVSIEPTNFLATPTWPTPAAGDLDGDGKPELLVPTAQNQVLAFHCDGTAVAGWPVSLPQPPFAVATADLAHDGKANVFVSLAGGALFGFNADGSLMPGFAVFGDVPAIGDTSGDGNLKIVTDSSEGVYVYNSDGSVAPGWPQPHNGTSVSPVLADADGDGISDIIIRSGEAIYGWHGDGTPLTGFPIPVSSDPQQYDTVAIAVGDIDGDGYLDLVTGSGPSDNNLYAYQLPGQNLPQRLPWPMYGHDAQRSFQLMQSPVIASSGLSAVQGVPFDEKLLGKGGYPPYTWAISGGTLPPGLSLNAATGEIYGTPLESGTFGCTVQVTDGNGTTTTKAVTFTVDVIAITTASLPVATVGGGYSQTVTVAGGAAPYLWKLLAGTLPTGLALDVSTGTISGYPTLAGKYGVTLQVLDAQGRLATRDLTIEVSAWGEKVFKGAEPKALAVDGAGNYYLGAARYTVVSGSYLTKYVPSGQLVWENPVAADSITNIVVDSAGNVYAAGYLFYTGSSTYAFLSKYDVDGRLLWTRQYDKGMSKGLAVDAAGNAYVSGRMGQMLGNDSWLLAYDAAGELKWSKTAMAGDAGGLAVGPDGNIYASFGGWTTKYDPAGTQLWSRPYGDSSTGLYVDRDSNVIQAYSIFQVGSSLTKYDPAGNVVWRTEPDLQMRQLVVDGNGNSYLTGSVSNGTNTDAVTMRYDAGGNLVWRKSYDSGIDEGGEAIAVDQDSAGVYVGVGIFAPEWPNMALLRYVQPTIATNGLTEAAVNEPYSHSLTASRGVPPYTWSLGFGALPPGLTLDSSTGVISGTPWLPGTYSIPLKVTGAGGVSDLKYLSMTVNPPATPLSADFTATPVWGEAPVMVNFSDTSTNSHTSWSWLFGDGSSGSGKTASHLYTTPGTYTVSLTATGASGTDVITRNAFITILACSDQPVRLWASTPFGGINAAYGAAMDYDIIQLLTGDNSETLEFNRDVHVTLRGGYVCGYSDAPLVTTLTGSVRITAGTLMVENLRFR